MLIETDYDAKRDGYNGCVSTFLTPVPRLTGLWLHARYGPQTRKSSRHGFSDSFDAQMSLSQNWQELWLMSIRSLLHWLVDSGLFILVLIDWHSQFTYQPRNIMSAYPIRGNIIGPIDHICELIIRRGRFHRCEQTDQILVLIIANCCYLSPLRTSSIGICNRVRIAVVSLCRMYDCCGRIPFVCLSTSPWLPIRRISN